MTENPGEPAGEHSSLSAHRALNTHLGNVQYAYMCTVNPPLAERCLETLETQRGITECDVAALKAANAVKVFRAEAGRDKELIDGRFSGGFSCEIRGNACPAKVTAAGFQLLWN